MKVRRVVIGALVGTILGFMWVNVSWMILGLHKESIRAFPDPQPVADVLKAQGVESGIYVLPHMGNDYEDEAAMAAHMEDMKQGPYMMGVVRSGSLDALPTMGPFMVKGMVIQLLAALIAAILLAAAAPNLNYLGRFMFVAMLGVFAAVTGHLPNWNWWWFPADHTIVSVIDSVVAWSLAGLAMAAIIKPSSSDADAKAPAGAAADS